MEAPAAPLSAPPPSSAREGRLGLALSGGGFRASFFHIGVLARMASLGLLRQVEAISTVSGGSIIGALYYLHVKNLLEALADDEITDQHFVEIVQRVEADFLEAVKDNFLMLTFGDLAKNIRMAMPNYSRSDRLGELYDEKLYRPAFGGAPGASVKMRDLFIRPKGEPATFNPKTGNAARSAPVPMLTINATTLNTGRNWRFNAQRMGESPLGKGVASMVDVKTRLHRHASYDELPQAQRNFTLGLAVAASACVPALCPPLAVSGIYGSGRDGREVRVQLIDGGVFDNQGLEALMRRRCDRIIASDASGQMAFVAEPSDTSVGVLMRTNAILMDRVRELGLAAGLRDTKVPMALVHLHLGLQAETLPRGAVAPAEARGAAPFGVDPRVQERLAGIRTDLDSFTEVEARSLMLDGYLLSQAQIRGCDAVARLIPARPPTGSEPWKFLEMAPWMARPTDDYLLQLEVAGKPLFKYFHLARGAGWAALASLACLLVGAGVLVGDVLASGLQVQVRVWHVLVAALAPIAAALVYSAVPHARGVSGAANTAIGWVRAATVQPPMSALGLIVVRLHLGVVNRRFLTVGTAGRLQQPEAEAPRGRSGPSL
jgi:predicted acylesterase/phospholipase RssA